MKLALISTAITFVCGVLSIPKLSIANEIGVSIITTLGASAGLSISVVSLAYDLALAMKGRYQWYAF